MSRKMFLLLVAVFTMVFFVNAQEVEEAEIAETEEVAPGNKAEADAEIKEIDAVEKAKEADADAEITDDGENAVAKEVAEDEAAGKEEAELDAKNAEEIQPRLRVSPPNRNKAKKSGSWFSWMWPSGSDKAVAAPVVEAPAEPMVGNADNQEEPSGLRVALLYFPNILVDLTDIISGGIGFGAESGVEVRLTRLCQIGGLYGDTYFVEKGFDRRFGGGYDDGYNFQLVALASEKRYQDPTFGSVEQFICKQSKAIVPSPNDPLYKEKNRDYWAIGVEGGWLVKVRVDIHPVEIADFLASLIALDITGDNLK